MTTKDKQGLYLNGKFQTASYSESLKSIFGLSEIPKGFMVDEDYEANGYSIVDTRGVQHVYELDPIKFYEALSNLI
jgi:hypothetical protein